MQWQLTRKLWQMQLILAAVAKFLADIAYVSCSY